jgi:hypothetical protein
MASGAESATPVVQTEAQILPSVNITVVERLSFNTVVQAETNLVFIKHTNDQAQTKYPFGLEQEPSFGVLKLSSGTSNLLNSATFEPLETFLGGLNTVFLAFNPNIPSQTLLFESSGNQTLIFSGYVTIKSLPPPGEYLGRIAITLDY